MFVEINPKAANDRGIRHGEDVWVTTPTGARIIVVGVCMEPDGIEPFFGIVKQLSVHFVLAYNAQEFAATLGHIAAGRLDVRPLITGRIGLAEVGQAFQDLASPETHAKILVEPWR